MDAEIRALRVENTQLREEFELEVAALQTRIGLLEEAVGEMREETASLKAWTRGAGNE